jgi:hypothetical protein
MLQKYMRLGLTALFDSGIFNVFSMDLRAAPAIISSISIFIPSILERVHGALIYFRKKLRHMKRVFGWCCVVALLAACGENQPPTVEQQSTFEFSTIVGLYHDTIPVPNAIGKIVLLTINDDSTYSIVERTMYYNEPIVKPKSLAGKVEIMEQGSKLKLTPRINGEKAMWLGHAQGQLAVLDSAGIAPIFTGNKAMERIASSVARIGNDRLFSIDKGMVRYPLNVYGRPGGSTISVASFFLRSCSESELGLAAYYVHQFQGKMEGVDPLQMVLNKDTKVLKEMTQRLVLGASNAPLTASVRQETLTSLVFSKVKDQFLVMYTYLDANDKNWMGKDLYDLKNGSFLLISQGVATEMN